MKAIDLFAGIGGIRLGFEQAFGEDLETVFISEIEPFARKTYKANFEDSFEISGDITKINEKEVPPFDICLAGFPCQAFSHAGKTQGFDDNFKGVNRGVLFLEIVRLCEYHQPKVIFCENVKNLIAHDKGNTFKVIKEAFESIGYDVFYQVLNSKDFGVPQIRERVYIVAFRKDLGIKEFTFPIGNIKTCIKDVLEEAPIPSKYYISDHYLAFLRERKKRQQAKGNNFGYCVNPLEGYANTLTRGGMGTERNYICDPRPHSMTPTTRIKGEINKEDIRKLTPREWARLQGFPDDFKFACSDTQMYKQFGNSVTVNVIKAIAEKIKEALAGCA